MGLDGRRRGERRSLAVRASAGLLLLCGLSGLATLGVGAVGILGVRSTMSTGRSIRADELTTGAATASAARAIDASFATGQGVALAPDAAQRAPLVKELLQQNLPEADTAVTTFVALHVRDAPAEHASIEAFNQQWSALRNALAAAPQASLGEPTLPARLRSVFAPVRAHLEELAGREAADAVLAEGKARQTTGTTVRAIIWAMAGVLAAAAAFAVFGIRRVRRELAPEAHQAEFADSMQLADDELEAHLLIKRHLERAIPRGDVTVLNRNNSADRLEAVTPLSATSCLHDRLAHAEPRTCLAVRSGRPHQQRTGRDLLLECSICSACPGYSTCTPLTVGGEIIGAVLVNAPRQVGPHEQQKVRASVNQAAPVLANLRNLAVAEIRAATDALTGLPNRRALDDTLKRMIAQASRTVTPLSLLVLDLDNFKQVNDRHGHPFGDQALASVGTALAATVRESDFAARNGGEEFVVLLPDTDSVGARSIAERIRQAVEGIQLLGLERGLTVSIGVATYPDHAMSADQLTRLSDAALYVAKRLGRNRVEVATEDLQPESSITQEG